MVSSYELEIARILTLLNLVYFTEYQFSHPSVSRYRYDFYLPTHNILIEMDGEQHFERVYKFHRSRQDFEEQQKRDLAKSAFALNYGYRLLRISYCQINRAEDIISKFVFSQYSSYFTYLPLYKKHLTELAKI